MKNKLALGLLFLLVVSTVYSLRAQNLPADVDQAFGSYGFVTVPNGDARSIIDTGRELIVVGSGFIVRYSYQGAIIQQAPTHLSALVGYVGEVGAIQLDQFGQPKLIVVGFMYTQTPTPNSMDLMVARYDLNLNLDSTFGNGGYVQYQVRNYPISLPGAAVIQPDGKIIVTGGAGSDHLALRQFVLRLNPNGFYDSTFGTNGVTETKIGNFSQGESVVYTHTGIYVGGSTIRVSGSPRDATVSSYELSGKLNTSFKGNGVHILRDGGPTSIVFRDNRLVVAGVRNSVPNGFGLAQMDLNGNLDPSFGSGGFSVRQAPIPWTLLSLARQNDGKYATAGYTYDQSTGKYALLIARYNWDGSPDQNFVSSWPQYLPGTRVINANRRSNDVGAALVIPKSGRIVVAGYSIYNAQQTFLITQFNGF